MEPKYLNQMFSGPPINVDRGSIGDCPTKLKYIEAAYNSLQQDVIQGYLQPEDHLFIYKRGSKSLTSVIGHRISIQDLETNILAWYQFYDSLMCGEVLKS